MYKEKKGMTMQFIELKWCVGAHVSFDGTLSHTLSEAIAQGMGAVQFFMGNPYNFKRTVIDDKDIKACKKLLDRYPMHLFTHFPYIANLCGSVKSLAWSGNNDQDQKTFLVLKGIEHELKTLDRMAIRGYNTGVVFHPGSYKDRKKGLAMIAQSINRIQFDAKGDAKLILENSAGQGTTLGTTLKELAEIINGVDENKKKHLGVCIDTCHLFAVGDYNLSKTSEIERFFNDFDRLIGLKYLVVIHLNDSCTNKGSCVDRHECLGNGTIWNKSTESLVFLLEKCKRLNIPCVLETASSDMIMLTLLSNKYEDS